MMYRFWSSAIALMVAVTASGAELGAFYCYAPDPQSGVVYLSQVMPLCPMGERAGYGREFAHYLRATNRVNGDVTGYCVMRATLADIATAQSALATEPCPECSGARRFTSLHWPRSGQSLPADGVAQRRSPASQQSAPASSDDSAGTAHHPLLVVMGNSVTGKILVTSNQPPESAMAQAMLIRRDGWKTLLITSEPGFGAAYCVAHRGETRFFVSHAQPSIKDAISHARDFAHAQESASVASAKICGAPWRAQDFDAARSDEDLIDEVKDTVRKEVSCSPGANGGSAGKCPERKLSGTGVRG